MQSDGGSSELRSFFKKTWVRLTLVLDVVLLAVFIGCAIFESTKSSIINFNIAPVDATISVNGSTSYHNGSFRIHPGDYEIVISRDNLDSKTFHVKLDPDSNIAITAFLTNGGDLSFYELKENQDSYNQLAAIATKGQNTTIDSDTSAEEFIAKMQTNADLFGTELPFSESTRKMNDDGTSYLAELLSITVDNSKCKKHLCVKVEGFGPINLKTAESILKEKGFDLNYLEVMYEKY